MQRSSSSRSFKPGLIGASPMPVVRVAQLDQSAGVRSRRSQVRFLSWTPFQPLCLSSYGAGFVNPYSSVRVRPGAPFYGDHDVRAASRPVKAFVPVQVRLVTPMAQDCGVINSISPREGDGPGA